MSSMPAARSSAPVGDQRPRLFSAPASPWSEGERVRDLAASAHLYLDDWQEHVLDIGLGRRDDGMWAAFEVAGTIPASSYTRASPPTAFVLSSFANSSTTVIWSTGSPRPCIVSITSKRAPWLCR